MLESVTRRHVAIPETDVEIALVDWGGDGPLVLLHHANGFCGALWDEVAVPLSRHFRVVAVDARGHGDSSAPEGDTAYAWTTLALDLEAVAERLVAENGTRSVALGIGHSFGGTLTFAAASSRPALFDRVLMIDPPLFPRPDDALASARRPDPGLRERALRRRQVFASREAARRHFAGRELFAGWRPHALDLYVGEAMRDRPDGQVELKCAGEVEGAVFGGGLTLDIFARARAATQPALLLRAIHGKFPLAIYQAFADSSPADIVIEEIDAGHLVVMERPELVVEAALRFTGIGA